MKLHSGLFAIVAASIFWTAESKPNPRHKPSIEVEADTKAKSIRVANADAKPTIEVDRIRVADAKTIREAKDGSKHSHGNKDEIKPIRVAEDDTTKELSSSNRDDVSRIVEGTQSRLGEFRYYGKWENPMSFLCQLCSCFARN
mmetsp:Transcript_4528/g.9742  ORF Transcript_4528/g.9742 Transcript_4528/m.9742 type:complete len:143 (-) Transcript_4528:532-960(-)